MICMVHITVYEEWAQLFLSIESVHACEYIRALVGKNTFMFQEEIKIIQTTIFVNPYEEADEQVTSLRFLA